MLLAYITIDLAPELQIGPLILAWHGIMIAVGIALASVVAMRLAKRRVLDKDRVLVAIMALVIAGIVGTRFYYLAQTDPGALLRPDQWLGSRGFAFYGAILFGVPAVWFALRKTGRTLEYLDVLALAFPIGMVVGRIGDLILGEHYGPQSDAPWAIAYTSPDAAVPLQGVPFHSGALYEIVAALVIVAIVWPLRNRFRRPGSALWFVLASYALARFVIFFAIRDTDVVALGLRQAQWTSVVLVVLAALGYLLISRRRPVPLRNRDQGASAGSAQLRP